VIPAAAAASAPVEPDSFGDLTIDNPAVLPRLAGMSARPQVLTWITCDSVHIDPATGKHYLLGCFSNLRARQFPAVHPRMVWFLTLTDLKPGTHQLRLSYGRDMETLQKLIERPFEARHPLDKVNLINELRNLRFEEPGAYQILIEVDDEPLLVNSIMVSE
jgi:hypothetical protein